MDAFLPKVLDSFLRKHPLAMMLIVTVLALAACWIMIGSGNSILVYEGF